MWKKRRKRRVKEREIERDSVCENIYRYLQEMGSVPGWRKGIAVGQAGVAWLTETTNKTQGFDWLI